MGEGVGGGGAAGAGVAGGQRLAQQFAGVYKVKNFAVVVDFGGRGAAEDVPRP